MLASKEAVFLGRIVAFLAAEVPVFLSAIRER